MAQNINSIHRSRLSALEKLALFITEHVGTMGFFFIVFGWTVIWLTYNVFAPKQFQFDPFPAFVLWLFISNLIQLHLMPLIMIGQNLQSRHAELRAENDYETNKKAEKEVEEIIARLDRQEKLIKTLLEKLEKKK